MRLRRSLFFAAPATSAGRPSRRQPGETVQALRGRPGRPGAPELPQAPFLPAWGSEVRERTGRTSCKPPAPATRPSGFFTNHETRITAFLAVRFAWARKGRNIRNCRPDRRDRRQVTACLPTSARNCPAPFFLACLLTIAPLGIARHSCSPVNASLLNTHYRPACRHCPAARQKNIAPEPVSAHRPPFSVGLTTSAVSGSSRRPSGLLPLRLTQNEPMLRRGTFYMAQTGELSILP